MSTNRFACISRLFLWGVMIALCMQSLQARGNADPCLQMVRSLYRKLNAAPSSGQICQIRYTVQVRSRRNGKVEEHKSVIRMVMSATRMHVQSKEMEIYHEGNYAYTVVPSNKAIYISNSDIEGARTERISTLAAFQDTLFSMCSLLQCIDARDEQGRAGKSVLLQMDARARANYGINTVKIFVDTKQQMITRTTINYVSGNRLESVDIIIDDVNYNYRTNEFDLSVHSMFMNARQQLLPKYSGYTVVDNRNRAKKR